MSNVYQQTTDNFDNRNFRVRYRFGDKEFEAEGNVQDVNQHALTFLSAVMRGNGDANEQQSPVQIDLFDTVDESPKLTNNNVGKLHNITGNDKVEELLPFYTRIALNPETQEHQLTQHDQLLVITHFIQECMGKAEVERDDYKNAYYDLRLVPVKEPANLTARLNELIEQGYVVKGKANGFVMTLRGKNYIQDKVG